MVEFIQQVLSLPIRSPAENDGISEDQLKSARQRADYAIKMARQRATY